MGVQAGPTLQKFSVCDIIFHQSISSSRSSSFRSTRDSSSKSTWKTNGSQKGHGQIKILDTGAALGPFSRPTLVAGL